MTANRRREAPALAEAFERLVRRHRSEIFRTVLRLSRNREDAEDLTQTTFLNAYAALQRGAQPEAPRAWLHAIARNAGSRSYRQRRLVEVELDDETSSPFDEDVATVAELQAALAQLTLNQRAALLMREVGGLSAKEIASRLGVSPGAVATLLFRARRALRAELEGTGKRPVLGGVGVLSTVLRWAWLRLLGPLSDGSEVLTRSATAVGVAATAAGVALVTTSAVPRPAHAVRSAPTVAHALAATHVVHVRLAPTRKLALPAEVRGVTRLVASAPARVSTVVHVSAAQPTQARPAPVEQRPPEQASSVRAPAAPAPVTTAESPPPAPAPAAAADDPQPVAQAKELVTSAGQSVPSVQSATSAVTSAANTALPDTPASPPPVAVPAVTTPAPPQPPPVEPPPIPVPSPTGILPSG